MTLITPMILLAGLAALLGFYRLLVGPTRTDRVVALDLLFSIAVVFSLIAAVASGRTVYLDVAIGLVLTGFVATLAWARLIQEKSKPNQNGETS